MYMVLILFWIISVESSEDLDVQHGSNISSQQTSWVQEATIMCKKDAEWNTLDILQSHNVSTNHRTPSLSQPITLTSVIVWKWMRQCVCARSDTHSAAVYPHRRWKWARIRNRGLLRTHWLTDNQSVKLTEAICPVYSARVFCGKLQLKGTVHLRSE